MSAPSKSAAEVDELVTALLTASRVLVGVSARSLADVEHTVTLTQFRTLVVLHGHGEMNLNRLAALLEVTPSTAMRMIDRLLITELVTRRDNPASRREVLLDLAPAGRRIVSRVTAKRRQQITRIAKAMPVHLRTELVEALKSFADAAGEPETPSDDASAMGW